MATKKFSELTVLDTVNANLVLTVIPVYDISSNTTRKVTLQQINDSIEANIPFAAAAFTQANTPSQVANSASSYANAAFLKANTANTNAANADSKAVSAGVYANAAFAVANSGITDSWARDTVNAASSYANSGFTKANTANTLAQAAYDYANTIVLIDSWARDSVNSSSSYGNSAFAQSNTANTLAQAAFDAANNVNVSGNTGNVTFSNQVVQGTGDEYGGGGLYLAPGPNSTGNLQYLRVRGGDAPTHIHFDTGNNSYYDQYFGDDGKYLKLDYSGNVVIGTNSKTWTFDTDGKLTFPISGLTIGTVGSEIQISTTSADITILRNGVDGVEILENEVSFYTNNNKTVQIVPTGLEIISGNLTFPDNTVQTTAYTGSASSYANSSYTQANTANTLAQAAFDQANTGGGLTANSVATLNNKTFDVSISSNNQFLIQGQSITSHSGSGQVVILQNSPTISVLNLSDSQLNLDGGSGTYYWGGQSGVVQAGDLKAGVYSSDSSSNNSLFTFGVAGANNMSVSVEGSLFVGTALPSNDGGLNTSFPGWLVVQSGGKFGGDIDTLGGLTLYGNIYSTSACSSINFVANSSGDGFGASTMQLVPDGNLTGTDQYLIIDPTAPGHIHIRAGGIQDGSSADLFLGGEFSHFKVSAGANTEVSISANSHQFIYGNYGHGVMKFPVLSYSNLPQSPYILAGQKAFISDANLSAYGNFGAIVSGGGANNVPVFSDGTNWFIG